MNYLEEKKKNRFKYLNLLYEKSGGDKLNDQNMFELGTELGFDKKESEAVAQYLNGEKLLEHTTIGGGIAITHYGVKEVERALSVPEKPTHYFPPVNIINIHHMEGSQIQQGTVSGRQTGNFKLTNTQDLNDFIRLLKEKRQELKLNREDESEIEAEISTLESQIVSSRPKRGIIQESLSSIKRILEGAGGAIVAQQLTPFIPGLLSALK